MSFGVNIEITEGEEFDSVLSTANVPKPVNVIPFDNRLGWLLAGAALLLFVLCSRDAHLVMTSNSEQLASGEM